MKPTPIDAAIQKLQAEIADRQRAIDALTSARATPPAPCDAETPETARSAEGAEPTRTPATDRYQNDAHFRALVDTMRVHIEFEHAEFTPSEIHEAAMLAQILYEETTLRPRFIEAVHGADLRAIVSRDGWERTKP